MPAPLALNVAPPVPPRATLPPQPVSGPASRYLFDLPFVYHADEFLGRYLQIFETLWEPLERRQDHIEFYFDPQTAPAALLGWLAAWLDLPLDPHWPEARCRQLIRSAVEIYRWNGTRYGLERLIEACTGVVPVISDEPDQPFVMRVLLPMSEENPLNQALVERLIRSHKPAHVAYILEFRGER
jgi:phage tail-like protein